MKYLQYYKQKKIPEEQVFEYFTAGMRSSIASWNYFVDWDKVQREATKLSDELNLLNGLIGSMNLRKDFLEKLNKYPSIMLTFPVLLAVRDSSIEVSEVIGEKLSSTLFQFHPKTEAMDPDDCWNFFEKSGLAAIFENRKIKNLTDYVFGVEVGLDTNGRKNRGGTAMENLTESFVEAFCGKHNLEYLSEANAERIKNKFDYLVPVDKSSRRYDFVIDLGSEPLLIETNFYGGGGSKLKSTAGEYRNLFDVLKGQYKFVWITDGAGWKKTLRPLRETFEHNDYVFNLSMIEDSILDEFI